MSIGSLTQRIGAYFQGGRADGVRNRSASRVEPPNAPRVPACRPGLIRSLLNRLWQSAPAPAPRLAGALVFAGARGTRFPLSLNGITLSTKFLDALEGSRTDAVEQFPSMLAGGGTAECVQAFKLLRDPQNVKKCSPPVQETVAALAAQARTELFNRLLDSLPPSPGVNGLAQPLDQAEPDPGKAYAQRMDQAVAALTAHNLGGDRDLARALLAFSMERSLARLGPAAGQRAAAMAQALPGEELRALKLCADPAAANIHRALDRAAVQQITRTGLRMHDAIGELPERKDTPQIGEYTFRTACQLAGELDALAGWEQAFPDALQKGATQPSPATGAKLKALGSDHLRRELGASLAARGLLGSSLADGRPVADLRRLEQALTGLKQSRSAACVAAGSQLATARSRAVDALRAGLATPMEGGLPSNAAACQALMAQTGELRAAAVAMHLETGKPVTHTALLSEALGGKARAGLEARMPALLQEASALAREHLDAGPAANPGAMEAACSTVALSKALGGPAEVEHQGVRFGIAPKEVEAHFEAELQKPGALFEKDVGRFRYFLEQEDGTARPINTPGAPDAAAKGIEVLARELGESLFAQVAARAHQDLVNGIYDAGVFSLGKERGAPVSARTETEFRIRRSKDGESATVTATLTCPGGQFRTATNQDLDLTEDSVAQLSIQFTVGKDGSAHLSRPVHLVSRLVEPSARDAIGARVAQAGQPQGAPQGLAPALLEQFVTRLQDWKGRPEREPGTDFMSAVGGKDYQRNPRISFENAAGGFVPIGELAHARPERARSQLIEDQLKDMGLAPAAGQAVSVLMAQNVYTGLVDLATSRLVLDGHQALVQQQVVRRDEGSKPPRIAIASDGVGGALVGFHFTQEAQALVHGPNLEQLTPLQAGSTLGYTGLLRVDRQGQVVPIEVAVHMNFQGAGGKPLGAQLAT